MPRRIGVMQAIKLSNNYKEILIQGHKNRSHFYRNSAMFTKCLSLKSIFQQNINTLISNLYTYFH